MGENTDQNNSKYGHFSRSVNHTRDAKSVSSETQLKIADKILQVNSSNTSSKRRYDLWDRGDKEQFISVARTV